MRGDGSDLRRERKSRRSGSPRTIATRAEESTITRAGPRRRTGPPGRRAPRRSPWA
ncbi:hypothetical protein [Ornithinimicrobium kibberense]|uniref:hypothetical protein n=1 Tax=Ornithinimicrobium kibberense TaxID=282060 RepID=UPI00360E2149